jgi:hypothetical protein
LLDAGYLRRNGAHDERGDEIAWDVDTDSLQRQPPALELDARLDLERDVGRPLHLVPAADTVREVEHLVAG